MSFKFNPFSGGLDSTNPSGYLGGDLEVTGKLTVTQTISSPTFDSSKVDSTYTTVNTNSASWGTGGSGVNLTEVATASSSWNSTTTTVRANSAQWATDNTSDTEVRSLTGKYESTYTTVNTNSASWGAGEASVNLTEVATASASWNNVYTTVNTNSASWGTGGSGAGDYLPLSGGILTGNTYVSGADLYQQSISGLTVGYDESGVLLIPRSFSDVNNKPAFSVYAGSPGEFYTVYWDGTQWVFVWQGSPYGILATNTNEDIFQPWVVIDSSFSSTFSALNYNYSTSPYVTRFLGEEYLFAKRGGDTLGGTYIFNGDVDMLGSSTRVATNLVTPNIGYTSVGDLESIIWNTNIDSGTPRWFVQRSGALEGQRLVVGESVLSYEGNAAVQKLEFDATARKIILTHDTLPTVNSDEWSSAYTTVNANSGSWEAGGSSVDISEVAAASGSWNNTTSTVNTNSGSWNRATSAAVVRMVIQGTAGLTNTNNSTDTIIPFNTLQVMTDSNVISASTANENVLIQEPGLYHFSARYASFDMTNGSNFMRVQLRSSTSGVITNAAGGTLLRAVEQGAIGTGGNGEATKQGSDFIYITTAPTWIVATFLHSGATGGNGSQGFPVNDNTLGNQPQLTIMKVRDI
jgi:hypothetical protein